MNPKKVEYSPILFKTKSVFFPDSFANRSTCSLLNTIGSLASTTSSTTSDFSNTLCSVGKSRLIKTGTSSSLSSSTSSIPFSFSETGRGLILLLTTFAPRLATPPTSSASSSAFDLEFFNASFLSALRRSFSSTSYSKRDFIRKSCSSQHTKLTILRCSAISASN